MVTRGADSVFLRLTAASSLLAGACTVVIGPGDLGFGPTLALDAAVLSSKDAATFSPVAPVDRPDAEPPLDTIDGGAPTGPSRDASSTSPVPADAAVVVVSLPDAAPSIATGPLVDASVADVTMIDGDFGVLDASGSGGPVDADSLVDAASPAEAGQAGPLDPCAAAKSACGANATCFSVDSIASSCACDVGFGGDGLTCLPDGFLVPMAAFASSSASGDPANVIDPDLAWWISAIDSGNPEWLEYDLGDPAYISAVEVYVGDGRQGGGESLQGSDDAVTWTTIATLDDAAFVLDAAPWDGWASYSGMVQATVPYRFVRLYSAPSPYLFYSWMGLRGVLAD
jgi:hypothetical protein